MTGPDFLIVGAPKCGTTAMDTYLTEHPQIYMATSKESHFFAPDMLRTDDQYRSAENYSKLFADRTDELIAGESSVLYLFSDVAAAKIHEYQPDAKIIIMLRNPVDVIASYHAQLVFVAEEEITDLRAALAAEIGRKISADETPPTRRPRKILHYRDVVRFSEQVARFLNLFDRRLVHIILFDHFKKDTASVYRQTLEFLGVNPEFQPSFDVVNPNKVARSPMISRLTGSPPKWLYATARTLLPKSLRSKFRRSLVKLNTQFVPREPMSRDMRRELQIELRPEIERLSEVISRDLSSWCEGGATT